MKIYVLDTHGYDQRGGGARVFSTLEKAQAASGAKEWIQRSDVVWDEDERGDTICDIDSIVLMEVDSERFSWEYAP